MERGNGRLVLVIGLLVAGVSRTHAMPPGSPSAKQAMSSCKLAQQQTGPARVELLTRGLEMAEAAVDADANDALAQFALFCNLGRRIQATGVHLAAALEVFRARRALDTALALAPNDPDVVAAKGALLVELPRALGGDESEGEACLRRALTLDPHHDVARGYLAESQQRRRPNEATRN